MRRSQRAGDPLSPPSTQLASVLTPRRLLAGALCIASLWIVHGFLDAMLAACVTAVASWPWYERFRAALPSRIGRGGASVLFTLLLSAVVLAPLALAGWALLGEARALLLEIAEADTRGLAFADWFAHAPIAGAWLPDDAAQPGALLRLMRRTDTGVVLRWFESLGHFTLHNLLTVGFTILLLCFLHAQGDSLARALAQALEQAVGPSARRYLDASARAVRGVVSSMFVVGLFDACATALAYTLAGTPRALEWAAITGALAAIPFLGYAAVGAMALALTVHGAGSLAASSFVVGCAILLGGDKLVRPWVARGEMQLPVVWVLMESIGGFGVLGLAGLVAGPVVLSLARMVYEDHVRTPGAGQ